MPKTNKNTTIDTLEDLKVKLTEIKLKIKAGQEKNTNAHKKIKVQIAKLLSTNKK